MADEQRDRMRVDLGGMTALVTGGGTGIGRAISLELARCGCRVAVNYCHSEAEAKETAAEIASAGGEALAIQADVTDEQQVREMIDRVCEAFGGLDILAANAGGPDVCRPTGELAREDWEQGFELNCTSVFLCVKYAVGKLPDGTGRIIVTSSISARTGGGAGMISYAAGKGALNNMVRGWAKEFAPRGITVNGIAPGIIRTRLHERNTPPDAYQALIERVPLKRDGRPGDCVGAVLLLAGEDGGYITGQIIEINGGMLMP